MNWSSWSDFFAMGGYAVYVWGSFGMCAAVLALEVALLVLRRRALDADSQDAGSGMRGADA